MTEENKISIEAAYNKETHNVREVLQVFIDQFGEDYVDNDLCTFEEMLEQYETLEENYDLNDEDSVADAVLSSIVNTQRLKHPDDYSGILVTIRFPKVTVTNEFDKSTDIEELYVRITVNLNGTTECTFTMTRGTYTIAQWEVGYAHSHLPRIEYSDPGAFKFPCTGTGPINRTIDTLRIRYDLGIWGLYAFEISKYVTVESIAGVPYIRLENINKGGQAIKIEKIPYTSLSALKSRYPIGYLKDFLISFILSNHIKVAYRRGNFALGENFGDFWLRVSNAFIKWYNLNIKGVGLKQLIKIGLLGEYIIEGGLIYPSANKSAHSHDILQREGQDLFMFKGNMVKLHFVDNGEVKPNFVYLISKGVCFYLITRAFEIINYNYGRTKERSENTESQASPKYYYA